MDKGSGWAAGNSGGGRGVRVLGWGFPMPRWGRGNVSVAVFLTAGASFGGWAAWRRWDPGVRSARGGWLKPGWGSPLKRAGDRKEIEDGVGLVYHR